MGILTINNKALLPNGLINLTPDVSNFQIGTVVIPEKLGVNQNVEESQETPVIQTLDTPQQPNFFEKNLILIVGAAIAAFYLFK